MCPWCFFIHMSGTSPGIADQPKAGQATLSVSSGAKLSFLTARRSQSRESFYMVAGFPWLNTLYIQVEAAKFL